MLLLSKSQKAEVKNTKLFLNNYAACVLKTYDNWKFDGGRGLGGFGAGFIRKFA